MSLEFIVLFKAGKAKPFAQWRATKTLPRGDYQEDGK